MVGDEEFVAARAVMSGFGEDDPVLARVSTALGSSALTLPRRSDGSTKLSNDTYEATVGGRPVGVQVLALGRPDTDNERIEAARARVTLMARTRSPHVVRVVSPVSILDGYPGALCWLEEPTLPDPFMATDRIRNGPWSVEPARTFLAEFCAGVAEFHTLGARAWPRFGGIGRRPTGEYVVTNGNFTSALRAAPVAGALVLDLVPYFQSPEDGRAGPPALAGDVYTLGVLAFLVLTGRPPVAAGQAPAHDFLAHTAEDAQAYTAALASMRSPAVRSVRPDVPNHLASVIDRCLQPDERDRYRDAADVLDHLVGTAPQ